MVTRKKADQNMGHFNMTRDQANELIEKARKGKPVDALDLYRATMVAYQGREPRKLLFPVLHAAERMRMNAALLFNLGQARYNLLKEKTNAVTANREDESVQVRGAHESPDGG